MSLPARRIAKPWTTYLRPKTWSQIHIKPIILLGDLNTDVDNPVGTNAAGAVRRVGTAKLLGTMELVSQQSHFLSRKNQQGWQYM